MIRMSPFGTDGWMSGFATDDCLKARMIRFANGMDSCGILDD